MSIARRGQTVAIHYIARMADGRILEKSEEGNALEFEIGAGTMIPILEDAILGMEPGQSKSVEVAPGDGYGPFFPDLRAVMPKSALPLEGVPKVGMALMMQTPQGQPVQAKVIGVAPEEVMVDANHPLAGRAFSLELKLLSIRDRVAQPV